MTAIKLGTFGILERDGKVLMGLRNDSSSSFQGCWCHPGGGIEFRELMDDALRREFMEEVGLVVDVGLSYTAVHEWFTNERHVVLILKQVFSTGEPFPGDGFSKVGWFTIDEIRALNDKGETTPLTIVAAEAWQKERVQHYGQKEKET